MTIYERILGAVSSFGLPAVPHTYTGTADSYFVVDVSCTSTVDGDDEPVFAYYQGTLSLFTPVRVDTVEFCAKVQRAIFEAGFSFPVLSTGGTSMDGARKEQIFTFGRWDDWQPSI